MGLRLRLARFGRRNAPVYNIVAIDGRRARNAKPIEVIGTYDPIPKPPVFGQGPPFKEIKIDRQRAMYWLGVGGKPSETVGRLFGLMGIMPKRVRPGVDEAETASAVNTALKESQVRGEVEKEALQRQDA